MRLNILFSAAAATTAVIAGIPNAHADLLQMAPHEQSIVMPDGWKLAVGHRAETANRVAPLNTIGTTREVFVTNQAFGSVGGSGSPLKGVVLKTGYHLGCAMDITGITLGGTLSLGIVPSISITPTVPMPTIGANIGPSASIAPSFSVSLVPGKVVDLSLGEKPLEGAQAFITNRDAHVKIDGCTAPASIRSYTIIAGKSAMADDSVAVYGDPVVL
jgi:hypothetical protein